MKQTLQIIGGKFRGKKLPFPQVEGLRPTPNRIRETLFNWLMHDIREARCLDAFAGSGALGFEAYSRGAAKVIFLEKDLSAWRNLQTSALTFHSTQLEIIHTPALDYLNSSKEQFDIIFLDPPFAEHYQTRCLELLEDRHCLVSGGLIYIESPHPLSVNEQYWRTLKQKQNGQVCYSLYRFEQ